MMRRSSTCFLVLGALLLSAAAATPQAAAAQATQAKPTEQTAATQAPPAKSGSQQAPAKSGNQQAPPKPGAKPVTVQPPPLVPAPPVPQPPGYVIGPDDVLQVQYWREKDVSADVVVRPDGMISLPLLNDVKAAGLTPEQLREAINQAATKFFEEPNVTINIKAINSRKVSITGSVAKPNTYLLTAPTTVLQLISTAGGLTEFAKQKDISVVRTENGKPVRYPFNYKDVAQGKNLKQNIELKPGDTVIVP